jgi:O-antigen/teichoic acid export membrane protein
MGNKSASLASESAIMLLSSVGAGIFITLTSIVIARSVSVANYGVYSLVVSIQAVVSMFASFSIGTALTKFIAEHRARQSEHTAEIAKVGVTLVLIISAVTSMVYVALGEPLGGWLYHESEITSLIPFSAFVVLSTAAFATAFGIAQGCQRIRLLAFMKSAAPMFGFGLVLVLLGLAGLKGVFVGIGTAQLAAAVVVLYLMNRNELRFLRTPTSGKRSHLARMILGYSIPTTISASLVGPVYWFGNTELALSTGFEAVGLFGIAFITFQGFAVLPNSISVPLFPRVSNSAPNSMEAVNAMVLKSVKATTLFLFPLAFGVGLFAEPIVDLFFGAHYVPAAQSMFLMAVASFFYAQGAIIGAMIAGLGRVWLGLGLNVIWAASFVGLTVAWIPPWGVVGLAASFAVSYSFLAVISFAVCKMKLGIDLRHSYLTSSVVTLLFIVGYAGVSGLVDLRWIARGTLLALGCLAVIYIERQLVSRLIRTRTNRAG